MRRCELAAVVLLVVAIVGLVTFETRRVLDARAAARACAELGRCKSNGETFNLPTGAQ